MAKLLKISGRTLGILLEWVLILVIVLAFAIRTSPVQTFFAQQAASYLSKELNTTIKIDKVDIVFIDEVALDGFLILDEEKDTLIAAKTVFAELKDYDLKKTHFTIGKVTLEEGAGHIKKDKDGKMNIQFLKDYFKPKNPSTKKKNVHFDISTVELINSRFAYDDNRKEAIEKGMDYAHIYAHSINGTVDNIEIINDSIIANVRSFSALEKSGFRLESLTTQANVSPAGVYLSDLHIKSDKSTIQATRMNMKYDHFEDFKYFVDSVYFDAQIDESLVSLEDVALFGHPLDGMNDMVRIKANVTNNVNHLKISDLDLRMKNKTHIKGTINLPNFKKLESAFFHEKLDYAYIDIKELEQIRLPNSAPSKYISMDERLNRLSYFEAIDVRLDGFYSQFVLASDRVSTALGSILMDNGILFTENKANSSYLFQRSEASTYDVKIDQFQLGQFMNNSQLGEVDGIFFLSGEAFSLSNIVFNDIQGDLNRFDFLGYSYNNINITDGTFKHGVFNAKVDIADDNLDLVYDGFIDLNGKQQMKFEIDLTKALLEKIGITTANASLNSKFSVDLTGTNPNDFSGLIKMDGFVYKEEDKTLEIPELILQIERSDSIDKFFVASEMADIKILGKLDFNHLLTDINYQFSRIFPSLYKENQDPGRSHVEDHFTFDINVKNADNFLSIFTPNLSIAHGSTLKGHYFGESSHFITDLNSDKIVFKEMVFDKVSLHQVLDSNSLFATYHVNRFQYNDSIGFNDLYFKATGGKNSIFSEFTWDQNTPDASSISWSTEVQDLHHYDFILDPSYFSIQGKRWEIAQQSSITIDSDTIHVSDFRLQRGEQYITAGGQVSNQDKHRLKFEVNDLELDELAGFFTENLELDGRINAWGYVSNPYNNLNYIADAHILKLAINNESVGDIFAQSEWDAKKESVVMRGDLMYKGNQTFDFIGDYYVNREDNNLEFGLVFDHTDIQFTNAFMDPDVVSEIRGYLNGTLAITGSPDNPILEGTVNLDAGSANVEILGAHFGFDGPIEVDKYGFYINGIPVFDEEGNAGSLIGSVYHDNFQDFNFDLLFDLETDAINKDPEIPWKPVPLKSFLVMNSEYSPDVTYYGKAYVTGIANIFGYTDNLEITVDVESKKGTQVNFPMYGVGEISSEDSFIEFVSKDSNNISVDPKIDFTGVELDLHMKVTPDAEMKIIFNEDLGDIITANGSGDMTISVDNLGDIAMDGVFTVNDGAYDFAMGPIRQTFYIEKGGNIAWTGNPYNANLNLRTYHKVNANIGGLSPAQFGTASGAHEEVLCYLKLNESLMKPTIGFDIDAPKANDAGKSLIARVRGDQEELNRQFFSLLLWKQFQPLSGETTASGGAAVDLIANQINSLLSKVSSDYKLNINLDNDQITGDNTFEFGVKKGFLDDRLILSGSFGVENQKVDDHGESSFIGDLNLEYLLNESGTFRVNIFNESNDKTIIQNQQRGHFTQGAGFHYQEDFNTVKDFKVIQYFLDIFRKKKNKRYPIKRKRKQTPVPKNNDGGYLPQSEGIIEKDKKG